MGDNAMTLTYDLSPDHVREYAVFEVRQNPAMVKSIRRLAGIGTAVFFAIVPLILLRLNQVSPPQAFSAGGIASIFLYFLMIARLRRSSVAATLKLYSGVGGVTSLYGRHTLTIDRNGLKQTSPKGVGVWRADAIQEIVAGPSQTILRLGNSQGIVIPQQGIGADDLAAFLSALRDARGQAGVEPPVGPILPGEFATTYVLTADDTATFVDYHAGKLRRAMGSRQIPVFFALLAVIMLLIQQLFKDDPWAPLALGSVFSILLGYWLFTRRFSRRMYLENLKGSIGRPQTIKLNDAGFKTQNHRGEMMHPWGGVQELVEGPEHWFIYVHATSAAILPKRNVSDGQMLQMLKAHTTKTIGAR